MKEMSFPIDTFSLSKMYVNFTCLVNVAIAIDIIALTSLVYLWGRNSVRSCESQVLSENDNG